MKKSKKWNDYFWDLYYTPSYFIEFLNEDETQIPTLLNAMDESNSVMEKYYQFISEAAEDIMALKKENNS